MCDIPKQNKEELSTDTWKQVIRDASLIGAKTIVFSGGEPLLREDIFELISFTKENNLGACITSNGSLIDEIFASRLSQAGVDVVNVSIEGNKNTHDYLRGQGSFERAVSALENLRKCKIEATVASMVSSYNYRYLNSVVELAKKHGATTVKFQPFSRIFLEHNNRGDDFLISDLDFITIKQTIADVVRLCREYGINTNPKSYLEMMPYYLSNKFVKPKNGCSVIWSSCSITSKGEIYPCWYFQNRLVGNIKENRLMNLWLSEKHLNILKKIDKTGCQGCMMSCYDENFGKEQLEEKIAINIGRLKNEGIREYIKHSLKKWGRRIKFYSSYRGSLKSVINKCKGLFKKRKPFNPEIDRNELDKALQEIIKVRQMFLKELEH
jgi:MoaA/NifB/PqqE/SkfB family radical SAM enzyme